MMDTAARLPISPGMTARDMAALAGISLAVLLIALDITIVAVALPDVERSLGASFTDLQWLLNGYTLAFSALLLSVGALADRYGRRRVFLIGMVLFAVSSAACAFAPTADALNVARLVQGASGSLVLPTSIALLAHGFRGERQMMAFGVFGTVFGLGLVAGPILGGALVALAGWPAIFLVNLPVAAGAILLTRWSVEESRDPNDSRLDIAGLLTSTAALACLFYVLILGNEVGWTDPSILAAALASVILLTLFIISERRAAYPMLDLSLFRQPTFVGMSLVTFFQGASFWALPVYLPLYFQNVLGYSPLQAGLVLLPVTLPLLLLPPLGARIAARVPAKPFLALGMVGASVGIALLVGFGPGDGWSSIVLGSLVAGAATGIVNNQITNIAVVIVPDERAGMASGANSMFRHVGFGFGIATLGAVLSGVAVSHFRADAPGIAGLSPDAAASLARRAGTGSLGEAGAGLPAALSGPVEALVETSFLAGLNAAFATAAGLSFAAALAVLLLVRERDVAAARARNTDPSNPEEERAHAIAHH
jgi:EmrB/QacA subfamily drug resistance transporter